MSFVVRNVHPNDLKRLVELAGQFSLLNLPADRKILQEKIDRSVLSFAGQLKKKDAEYLFVLEDTETGGIVGSSLILAKHGSPESPHYCFCVLKKNRFSDDLGVGFIHQVLRLKEDTDGPTEIGGLLIDRTYRRRPEKLGKQISLMRFVYIGMNPDRFEKRVLCELTPPLGEGGRSEFWEALGRRFTGLPYQEADLISQKHKEFIKSLFPEEDIYLALLDSRARLVLGRVGPDTRPAQHLLESIGFKYVQEVDPFDGGPHFGADTENITIVKNGQRCEIAKAGDALFTQTGLVGIDRDNQFRGMYTALDSRDGAVILPEQTLKGLGVEAGDEVFVSKLT